MVEQPGIDSDKSTWRAWARAERATLDLAALSESVVAGLTSWPPIKSVRTILTYLPMADEVNLGGLSESARNGTLLATRTPEQGGSLTIHELGGPLEVHRLGFLQPHASAPEVAPEDVDLVLVPGLAFDLWGTRLGRGVGYYDELIGRMSRRVVRVGVVPAALVVDHLPREDHDQPMAFLATEEGVVGVARDNSR
jgi:5-formyltetrahydrofolate cyclo-ligase